MTIEIIENNKIEVIKPNSIILGDSMELMDKIPTASIDLILTDLPYGRTRNSWDEIIPLEDYIEFKKRNKIVNLNQKDYYFFMAKKHPKFTCKQLGELWRDEHKKGLFTHYKRIIKKNGAIVLFSDGMFTAHVMKAGADIFKYNLVWNKILKNGHLNANRRPLRQHETLSVFYKKQPYYNPQKTIGEMNHSSGDIKKVKKNNNYGEFKNVDNREKLGNLKHPTSIIEFQKPHPSISIHPTQKPVELYEWVIKSFTKESEVVLDNTMGSGTIIEACEKTNRKPIGIEKEKEIFEVAKNREKSK